MTFPGLTFVFILAFISSASTISVSAQNNASAKRPKIEFGTVSLDEMEMKVYEKDSAADAVILSDIGSFSDYDYKFTRHLRVKILRKSGLDWGNWVFNTPSSSDFRIFVFNLENGQIIKEKVENKSIYKEKVIDDFEVYKVFAPNVKVGSVVDITYSFVGFPLEWRFQERIPVAYSRLYLPSTPGVIFNKTHFGFESIEALSANTWQAIDMPAFHIEPFLNNYANYITKFEFQLESFRYYGRTIALSTSWRKVIENLLKSPDFGVALKSSNFLNDIAGTLKDKNMPTEQAVTEAYRYIQKNARWNGQKTLFVSGSYRKRFEEEHTCNSAEINLALIALLNKMGITTHPIVLSTRDNGMLVEYSPTVSKLNYVIGYVDHGGVNMFLDATSEHVGIPGILPSFCLNGRGLLVLKDNEQWLTLNNKFAELKNQFINISLDENGIMKAKLSSDYNGYAYLDWAERIKANKYDAEICKNELQKKNKEIQVSKYEITRRDSVTFSGREVVEANLLEQVIDGGDEILLSPFIFFDYSENPFKAESRKYPVDLTYPREIRSTILVQHPKNLTATDLPAPMKYEALGGAASFVFLASATEGNLQFKATLKLSNQIYTETEYVELRQFFSEVVKVITTPIRLAKKT